MTLSPSEQAKAGQAAKEYATEQLIDKYFLEQINKKEDGNETNKT